ncbi:YfcL family protein [Pseudoalteromonas sp. T1lg75]|uniref:YfcL family protein n=1 Tax=Pseudoalteromonas sp. T1lg75 TaxID=2077102 RepID=UPI000CF65745|nr:YfcL family protein [Pseudoalteromonas sp. T1lg75]
MPYSNYVDAAQHFFDDLVDHADDDQLFAGGYLRGHFDLAVGYAQVENLALSPQELNEQIEQSLVKAYRNGELTDIDRDHMVAIWEQVKALAN